MSTFESHGFEAAYDDGGDDDTIVLLPGIAGRVGAVPGLAGFR